MDVRRVYFIIARAFPEHMKPALQRKLIQAGIDEDVNMWIGRLITTVALMAFACGTIPFSLVDYPPVLGIDFSALTASQILLMVSLPLFLSGTLIAGFFYYMYLFYRVQGRADAIDKVLPDFIMIVVSNLHAGMSPFTAFIAASRPEFGALDEEIKRVSARTAASQSLSVAMMELSQRFDSEVFEKTIVFFEKAMRSGGQMAKILRASADEIRHIQDMREDLISQTRSYVIFLGFMIVAIAPFLFAVSSQFLTVFLHIRSQASMGAMAGFEVPIFQGAINLTPEFVDHAGMGFLIFTSALISFFMGSIMKGKPIYGFKYFPVLAVASLVVYSIAKTLVSGLLSAFAG